MSQNARPIGPLNASIAIVGGGLFGDDSAIGLPFQGYAGQMLSQMLMASGCSLDSCYRTLSVPDRLQSNLTTMFTAFKRKREFAGELQSYADNLVAEIGRVKPAMILALGPEAHWALTGRLTHENWRGSIQSTAYGKLITTYSPSQIMATYPLKVIAQMDIRRAVAESTSRELNLPRYDFRLAPTLGEIIAILRTYHEAKFIAFDIETLGPHCRCIALSPDGLRALCIPFISSRYLGNSTTVLVDGDSTGSFHSHWTPPEEHAILAELDRLFSNPNIAFIAQNAQFDIGVLVREFGIQPHNLWMDTMLAQHTCYPELPKGLDFLCSIYDRTPCYWEYNAGVDSETWKYNCYDAAVTWRVSSRLARELQDLGLEEFYFSHVNPAGVSYAHTQQRGVLIDDKKRKSLVEDITRQRDIAVSELRRLTGRQEMNFNSDTQLKDYLYNTLRLPPIYNRKTGTVTTDKNAIRTLSTKHPNHKEFFHALQTFTTLSTLLSGFLTKPLAEDGRIRTSYNVAGTVTGRLSSSEALFDISTNLQNIPSRTANGQAIRGSFVADPGEVLIKADLSQAEFRLVCWLAKIERLILKYTENPDFDVHRWVASIIFNKPESEITKEERSTAKNGVYGGNYKMFYKRAAMVYSTDEVPFSEETAKFVLDAYRRAVPEIPRWWATVDDTLNRTRTIISPTGRKRMFFDRLDDELYRAAYSHSAQSIVGDIINRAHNLAVEMFPTGHCRPLLQIHDELLFGCHAQLVPVYAPKIKTLMEYPLTFPGIAQPCIVPVEISSGPSWSEQKKLKL